LQELPQLLGAVQCFPAVVVRAQGRASEKQKGVLQPVRARVKSATLHQQMAEDRGDTLLCPVLEILIPLLATRAHVPLAIALALVETLNVDLGALVGICFSEKKFLGLPIGALSLLLLHLRVIF